VPQYVGSVYLDVRFDSSQAARNLQTSVTGAAQAGGAAINSNLSDRMLAFGTQATRIGRQLSFGLAAPLALLGKSSEQAFVAFDTNMTKVAALTGVGAQQTAAWTDQVLAMGTAYGVTGEDAAAALYLITSSGLKGQQAMDTLEVSMKASAVGMGDAKTMAGLLTSAMNAYGPANLSAAKAADILTGAVQESKIPADELAGSLSQLLPFGPELGVGFDQITGAMAALSLQGTGAAQAATQLRGIFNSILQPSAQAEKALARVGLSSDALRKTLSTQGIVPMLRQIKDAIARSGGETDTELATMFGNVRALTGVFGLLNDTTGNIDRVMKNTADSAGKLNKAWIITADSGGFKAKQATTEMHNEMIQLGKDVAPVATAFLHVASAGVNFINALGPLKYALITIGGLLAVVGPVAYSVGALADVFGLAAAAAAKFGATSAAANEATVATAQGAAVAEGEVAAATEAVVAAQEQLVVSTNMAGQTIMTNAQGEVASQAEVIGATEGVSAAQEQVVVSTNMMGETIFTNAQGSVLAEGEVITSLEGVTAAEGGAAAGAEEMGAATTGALFPIIGIVAAVGAGLLLWNRRMQDSAADAAALGDTFANKVAGGGIEDANKTIGKTTEQIRQLREEADNVHAPWDLDYRQELYAGADALEAHVRASQQDIEMSRQLATQTGESTDKVFQWLSSERNAGRTYADSKTALEAYTKSMAEHGSTVSVATTETGKLVDKAKDLADGYFGVQKAQYAYQDAVRGVTDAQRKAEDAQIAVADARRAEVDAIAKVADAQDRQRESIRKVADARRDLVQAEATYQELLKGPTREEGLDVRSAQLAVQRAQKRMRGPFEDPLERQQAQIDLERAQIALAETRGEHDKNLAKAHDDVTRAQDNLTSAQKDAVGASKADTAAHRGVRDAEYEAVTATEAIERAQFNAVGTADALAKAQSGFADAVGKSNEGLDPLSTYLAQLQTLYPGVATAMQPYLDQLDALKQWSKDQEYQRNTENYGGARPPSDRRAMGGPLAAGQLSTVNELGAPELWSAGGKQYLLPVAAGHVTPLHPAIDASVTNQPTLNVSEINVYGADRPVQTAYEIRRQLRSKRDLVGRR
jgi:TP901 family phage tail tape measure protein